MFGTDYFQIVHGEGHLVGELTPTGDFTTLEVGTAMQRHADDGENFSQIAGTAEGVYGFLTKKVTEDGPSYERMSTGFMDLEAKKGMKVSLRVMKDHDMIEVEGEASKAHNASSVGHLVTSGTGAISSATALGTELSNQSGRWRVAQTGDVIKGVLRKQLTPVAADTNVRILVELVAGRALKA